MTQSTPEATATLRDPLVLERVLELADQGEEDVFTGPSAPMPTGLVYGGQLVAQAVIAAHRTIGTGRIVHSVHANFLRPARSDADVGYRVVRLTEGRSYAVRRVDAHQDGLVFTATVSFQHPEQSAVHAQRLTAAVPRPHTLPNIAERFAGRDDPTSRIWQTERGFDLRLVDDITAAGDVVDGPSRGLWFRSRLPLGEDEVRHRAAIAYASDFGLLHVTLAPHGRRATDLGLRMVSLDHALWLYEPARADEWLLFVQSPVSARSARGLAIGRIYREDGVLVALCAQEGVIRHPSDKDN